MNGDCITATVDAATGAVAFVDRFSTEQSAPPKDAHNDVEEPGGFRNDTHVVVWFKRKLRTGDPQDKDISATAGALDCDCRDLFAACIVCCACLQA